MIDKKQIRQVMSRVGAYPTPVLSLYISTNPARPDNSPRAVAMRAKSTLHDLAVPGELTEKVRQMVEHDAPLARTLAIFATDDEVDVLRLHMDLPIEDPITGHLEARWGEPYVLPLLLAADEFERYGVLYVDQDQWRFFAVSLGAIEEVARGQRGLSPREWDSLKLSKEQHPPYIPTRGGAAQDLAEDHIEDLSRRFYQEVAAHLQQIVNAREVHHLIAMGPERDVSRFRNAAPASMNNRISATLPSLPRTDFSASEVSDHVADTVKQLEVAREEKLLHDIGERGIRGVDACLSELQRGRLQVIAVPWPMDGTVYREAESGYVATSEPALRAARPDATTPVEELSLRDALPPLVTAYNTKLEFILGAHKKQLEEDFGGVGALARW